MSYSEFSSPATRRVWGSPDAVMLVFAASAAEFAASRAVDWLFFTGKLPEDPIARLFGTARFARRLAFADEEGARRAIEGMNRAHAAVERARGREIPAWAYRGVLFMLIDHGERAHGVVFGPMGEKERTSHLRAALAVGEAMGVPGLPASYAGYREERGRQLAEDYVRTPLTDELFAGYRRALGPARYRALLLAQAELVPEELRTVLGLEPSRGVRAALRYYRRLPGGGDKLGLLKAVALPRRYAGQLRELSHPPGPGDTAAPA